MSPSSLRDLSSNWSGRLAHFNAHRNDEHLYALYEECLRFVGLHLENDLSRSDYWSRRPLDRRLAVLLFLVDQGVVEMTAKQGRHQFLPTPDAEDWVVRSTTMRPFARATLELIAALRHYAARMRHSRKSSS